MSQNCVGNGVAVGVERLLLDDSGRAVRAADGDAPEGARRPSELPLDDREVVHGRDVSGAGGPARRRCRGR